MDAPGIPDHIPVIAAVGEQSAEARFEDGLQGRKASTRVSRPSIWATDHHLEAAAEAAAEVSMNLQVVWLEHAAVQATENQ